MRGESLKWRGRKLAVSSENLRRLYRQAVGPIPPGHQLHHTCENPWCVQPLHLEALTFRQHKEAHRYSGLALGFNETAF